jgi:peptidyl-prolyl cis-trans isomerase D
MFGTIRKHQNWLWAIIITGTIVSFLVWFSPDAKWRGHGRGPSELGSIDGRPITSQEFRQAYDETRLLYFLNFQKWPENDERARQMDFDVEQQAFLRLVRLAKVKEEKIQVSDETVGLLAQRLLGPKTPLDAFVKEILQPRGLTEADFERFLRNDAAIQQLGAVAGLSGRLLPPRELEAAYREEHEELDLQAVFFSVSNYLASVSINEPAVRLWYTNSMALFRVPEKVRVSYIDFDRTNFMAEVDKEMAKITNLNARIEQSYLKQDPEAFKDETGKVLSKEAALKKIKAAEIDKAAMVFAARKANDFASKLYDEKDHRAEAFEKYAASNGWPSRLSEPFDQADGPADLKVSENFARVAFALTNKDEAIAFQPVEGETGFYIFAAKEFIPSSNPPFESIREKVVERYRYSEAQKLTRQAALGFQARLTNGLAQGKSFATLATESVFRVISLPPISRAMRQAPGLPENISLPQLKNVAFSLQVSNASSYIPSLDGGYFLYLRGELPLDETRMKADLAEYAAGIRAQRQSEAFGMWFEAQKKAGVDLPLTRNTRQGAPAGGRPVGGKPGGTRPRAS